MTDDLERLAKSLSEAQRRAIAHGELGRVRNGIRFDTLLVLKREGLVEFVPLRRTARGLALRQHLKDTDSHE